MRRGVAAKVLLHCAREFYEYQLKDKKHFLRAHPAEGASHADDHVTALLRAPRAGRLSGTSAGTARGRG